MLERIKICGIKDQKSLDACLDIQIGFIGFNFVSKSPRFITPQDAKPLRKQINNNHIKVVALIVDEDNSQIQHIINNVKPDYIQLHGHETVKRVQEIRQKFKIPIIKAIGIAEKNDIKTAETYFEYIDILLLDTKPLPNDNLTGGTGKKFDWSLINQLSNRPKSIMLAGGLNHENLEMAHSTTKADFYDICSGVEKMRGEKSIDLIQSLRSLKI